jgi:hypothetical protein
MQAVQKIHEPSWLHWDSGKNVPSPTPIRRTRSRLDCFAALVARLGIHQAPLVVGDPQTENLSQHNSNHIRILTGVSI